MKEQKKLDMNYIETLKEKRKLIEQKQQMRTENYQKNKELNEINLKNQIEKLQNNNHIFEKRNNLFLEEIDNLSKKYQNKFVDVLASNNHLNEIKGYFYDFLCENYPQLSKDLRYALYKEKKELDVRLNYILENAKNIQEKQDEISKLKSQIAQRQPQILQETTNNNSIHIDKENNKTFVNTHNNEENTSNYESEKIFGKQGGKPPIYQDFETFNKNENIVTFSSLHGQPPSPLVNNYPLYKTNEYQSQPHLHVKPNSRAISNNDNSVNMIKSNNEPSQNEEDLAHNMKNYEEIDYNNEVPHENQYENHENSYHDNNENIYNNDKEEFYENHDKEFNEKDYNNEFEREENNEEYENKQINMKKKESGDDDDEEERIIHHNQNLAGEKKNLVGLMTSSSEFTSDRNTFNDFQKSKEPNFSGNPKNYLKFKPITGNKVNQEAFNKRKDNNYQPDNDEIDDNFL